MWWECSECGCRVRRQHQPTRCPECGISGIIFTEATADAPWEPGSGSLRDYWLEWGMAHMPTLASEQPLSAPG